MREYKCESEYGRTYEARGHQGGSLQTQNGFYFSIQAIHKMLRMVQHFFVSEQSLKNIEPGIDSGTRGLEDNDFFFKGRSG